MRNFRPMQVSVRLPEPEAVTDITQAYVWATMLLNKLLGIGSTVTQQETGLRLMSSEWKALTC